ncbi:MAG: hypothetical protein EBW61_12750, partial [Rhodobacteraceae bacterium]|nr:hypothetical protein [Paracoccaceae bacterium]
MSMGCFNLKTDENQILELINAEGIETVRVVFVDQHGILRGKTLVATALKSAFENGVKVPSTLTMPATPVKTENLTQGYQYLTETKYSEVEEVLDELRRMSQALGLEPQSIEIEMGPSQFEFTFAAADPQTQAERFVLFRTMVKEVCFRRGLHASFMPKPALPNAAANGWHLHQSLITTSGNPAFLTNPTVNSYKRFTPYQLAPNLIQWGRDNRGAMLRVLMHPNDPASRIENRVADTSANPFYAIAAQIVSGLDGITRGLKPPSATDTPYEGAEALPKNLYSAIEAFERSALFPKYFC